MKFIKWISIVLFPISVMGQGVWDTLNQTELMRYVLRDQNGPPTCFTAEAESFALELYEGVSIKDLNNHCLEIYVETDSFTVAQFGSVAATQAWIDRIEANAQIIFENEGIHMRIVSPHIPTTREWSDHLNDVGAILSNFGVVRKESPGDIKHFITRRSLGGGVAWVNMLCRKSGVGQSWGPFAVSSQMSASFPDYPAYSWTLEVFCHETGHVIASPHTHDCVWGPTKNEKIDDCVSGGSCNIIQPIQRSTIMSYCHLSQYGIDFTLGFGDLPGDLMRAAINNAACIANPPSYVLLQGEIQGEYEADTIQLSGVSNIGNLSLRAGVIQIDSSELIPEVNIYNNNDNGCN